MFVVSHSEEEIRNDAKISFRSFSILTHFSHGTLQFPLCFIVFKRIILIKSVTNRQDIIQFHILTN